MTQKAYDCKIMLAPEVVAHFANVEYINNPWGVGVAFVTGTISHISEDESEATATVQGKKYGVESYLSASFGETWILEVVD